MLGAVAFLVAQGALRNAMMLGALLALAFAGIASAGEWAKQDRISIAYLLFRYEMLKQLEDKAGVLFPILHLEENFYREGNGRIAHFGFSQSAARWLPRMFGLPFWGQKAAAFRHGDEWPSGVAGCARLCEKG